MSVKQHDFTAEQQALLALLAASLHGARPVAWAEASVDWSQVLEESVHHAVATVALEGTDAAGIPLPAEVLDRWLQVSMVHANQNLRHAAVQAELTGWLEEAGLPYSILKGAAAAAYYPRAEQRRYGDVDFLIAPADQPAVEALLTEKGYRRWNLAHDCHVLFERDDVDLEMHFAVPGIPAGQAGEAVRAYLQDTLARYTVCEQEGVPFRAPAPEDHGLILLLHMQHHLLSEGLGLRHVCDWSCFVARTLDAPFWQERLLPLLHRIGLFTFAAVMSRLCALYLCAPCPPWAADVSEDICAALLADILTGGNFGRKNKQRAHSGVLISQHGKQGTRHGMLYNLCATMHRAVCVQHPVVARWPILYPFLYIYRTVRFAWLRLTGRRDSLLGRVDYARERKAIYDTLHVFEPEEEVSL